MAMRSSNDGRASEIMSGLERRIRPSTFSAKPVCRLPIGTI
jgi:hypothetical protein